MTRAPRRGRRRARRRVAAVLGVAAVRRPAALVRRAATAAGDRTGAAPRRAPGRKIKARLFYVADDGTRLTGVERDVAYGEGAAEQAREIVEAQIAPVAEPLVSAIPPGTTLRAVFITDSGDAFVDLEPRGASPRIRAASLDELLTIYTIVNALTANLPAVTSVQLLVDGKEVDTLAGHVDLRRPLAKNLDSWSDEIR